MGLKVAIIGCGKIADAHVEEARKIPGVEVVAVCDQEPIMAEQLAVRYAIPRWFADSAEMLAAVSPRRCAHYNAAAIAPRSYSTSCGRRMPCVHGEACCTGPYRRGGTCCRGC